MSLVSPYTISQQAVLTITPIFTGLLSTFGTIATLYIIYRDKRKRKRITCQNRRHQKYNESILVYERIMIGSSIPDIFNSFQMATSTFLMPAGTPGVWRAYGNTATCSLQGFLTQVGLATTWYTISLALYFVFTIHPDVRIETIKRWEPLMHFIPIVFVIITAPAGLYLDAYNPLPLGIGCWVAAYPMGCDAEDSTIECTRGQNAGILMWAFGGFVVIFAYIVLIICMIIIYYSVWKQLRKMDRYTSNSLDLSNSHSVTRKTSRSSSKSSENRLRQVSTQGLLYIGSMFLTYNWSSISRVLEFTGATRGYFALSFLSQVFYPL